METIRRLLRNLSLRTHFVITITLTVAGLVLMWFGSESQQMPLLIIGFLFLVLNFFYSLVAFRCPMCNCLIKTRGGIPTHCPHCGAKLDGSAPRSLR